MDKSPINEYFETLKKRTKKSRVYSSYQGVGLMIAEILGDGEHKTIYMSLAKQYDSQVLIGLAKDVALRKSIENKGAYFMKVFGKMRQNLYRKELPKKIKQLKLKLRHSKK